jgi:hypothetical protein
MIGEGLEQEGAEEGSYLSHVGLFVGVLEVEERVDVGSEGEHSAVGLIGLLGVGGWRIV